MKYRQLFALIAVSFFAISHSTASAFDQSHSAFTSVLRKHVNSNGMADYAALQKNRSGLDNYLKKTGAVSKVEFSSWSEKAQISYLVNVYNAETLQLIIDDYPVDSIKDIGGFLGSPWLQKCVDLFGEKTTLAAIEKKMIIKNYDEPRTHFSLVCGVRHCDARQFKRRNLILS